MNHLYLLQVTCYNFLHFFYYSTLTDSGFLIPSVISLVFYVTVAHKVTFSILDISHVSLFHHSDPCRIPTLHLPLNSYLMWQDVVYILANVGRGGSHAEPQVSSIRVTNIQLKVYAASLSIPFTNE